MNMQMRLFSRRITECKDLTYHIRNDITTYNNEDFGMKSVNVWVFLTMFPHVLKISLLFMNMQKNNLHNLHVISGVCLSLNLVPSLVV